MILGKIIGICRQTTYFSPELSAAKHWRKAYLQIEYIKLNGEALLSIHQWYLGDPLHSQISHSLQS